MEAESDYSFTPPEPEAEDSFLEALLHSKSKILSTKLEVLAGEILWRFQIREQNRIRLDEEQSSLQNMLLTLDRACNYLSRQHREKAPLYNAFFNIEQQKRQEQTECWRDVAMVMRDFLEVWDAHEQTKSRAIFLENVGRSIEGNL